MGFFSKLFGLRPAQAWIDGGEWFVQMGWRYVAYSHNGQTLAFSIVPMYSTPDVVQVPSEQAWRDKAPPWANGQRAEILRRLKSIRWNRRLAWSEIPEAGFLTDAGRPLPGSIESTHGGSQLENDRLFHPESGMAPDQVRNIWHIACRRFADQAQGAVHIAAEGAAPDSVFMKVELPALKRNRNVRLVFIGEEPQ